MEKLVAGLMVYYKTYAVTLKCLKAFRRFYSDMPLLLIDNSNYDNNSNLIYDFAQQDKYTTCLFNNYNMHHGPSMDLGLHMLKTPLVFIMDSDLLLTQPNVLEDMHKTTVDKSEWLAVGNLCYVNNRGFNIRDKPRQESGKYIKYCNPKCMLVNRYEYFKYPPFILHGAPCIQTMEGIKTANKEHMLIDFDWLKYGKHLGGATQTKYGLDGKGGQSIPPFI